MAAGLVVGIAGVARAKLQCDPDTNVGRSHSATPLSATMDGQPIAIPSTTDEPLLGRLVFRTELYDFPSMVHVEVFDPNGSPPARIIHLSRVQ